MKSQLIYEGIDIYNASNYELCYVLENCQDISILNKAWEQLTKQEPSNDDLKYIFNFCPNAEIKEKASTLLRANLGVTEHDEKALIKMNNESTVLSFHQKKAHFEAGNRLLARIDQLELFKANLEGYSKDVEFRFDDANNTQKSVKAMTMIDQQDAMGNLLLIGISQRVKELKEEFEKL